MVESSRQPAGSQSKVDLQKGVDMTLSNLKEGKPVMAGVSYRDNQNINENVATDHFITIVGAGSDKKGSIFLTLIMLLQQDQNRDKILN